MLLLGQPDDGVHKFGDWTDHCGQCDPFDHFDDFDNFDDFDDCCLLRRVREGSRQLSALGKTSPTRRRRSEQQVEAKEQRDRHFYHLLHFIIVAIIITITQTNNALSTRWLKNKGLRVWLNSFQSEDPINPPTLPPPTPRRNLTRESISFVSSYKVKQILQKSLQCQKRHF